MLNPKLKIDLKLAGIFLACIAFIIHCYPSAQLTWDSYSYIVSSRDLKPSIRPGGYPFFLHLLNGVSSSFDLIVASQYLLYFVCVLFFLRVIDRIFLLKEWQYFLLGFILITEPVALYHCLTILSDVLFSALSLAYISTLILFVRKRSIVFFVIHVLLIFFCIEVRHIALFYPYFSFAVMLFYYPKLKPALISGAVIFGLNFFVMQGHIRGNEKEFGVPVYSAFSGWTQANNALYGMPYMQLDTNEISDIEIRRMHSFCRTYMDTSSFKMPFIGSGFLWDDKSPLCILRKKTEETQHAEFFHAWYLMAPLYSKYGTYLQTHYPMAYFKGYILPNVETLINPQDGEMSDYNITPPDINPGILEWYNKKPADLFVRHQIYKNYINKWNISYYHIRLGLFVLAMLVALIYYRKIRTLSPGFFIPVISFVVLFYALNLYSSWFMHRYLLPLIPLQVAVIFTVLIIVFGKKEEAVVANESSISN